MTAWRPAGESARGSSSPASWTLPSSPWWRTRSTRYPSPLRRLLGAVDPGERLGLDRGAVRQPRGETRRGRLLRARDPERAGELPYLLLADPGLEQRMDDAVLLGRPQAGPPVAEIVGVGAGEQRLVAPPRGESRRAGSRARSCSGSSGRDRCARYSARSSSAVVIVSWRIPTAAATRLAPSSSPVASAGETAVTASARSPSARAASAATRDESTPPENATTALPRRPMRPSSSSIRPASWACMGRL